MHNPLPPGDPGYDPKVAETYARPTFKPRALLVGLVVGAIILALEYFGARDLDGTADMRGAALAAMWWVLVGLAVDAVLYAIAKKRAIGRD